MIGASSSRSHKPIAPPLTDGVFLGAVSRASHSTSLSLKTRIYDDFNDGVRDWINVRGRLTTTGGASPDITAEDSLFDPLSWVVGAAGYHRTEMLSDNIRAKITVPDGLIINGTSQFWFCGDTAMTHYYGVEIASGLLTGHRISLIKGTSPNSWRRYKTTSVALAAGNTIEGWYDRPNSTLRMYRNGSQLGSGLVVPPTEIPHGPGRRRVGVIMGADWWIAPGGNFADFEAWDV
ncbi:minor tail protein [Mycobacterium phage Demsculpinboyz]|uniref:Minor tail protein n=1 Tax=Mycobacterium phage Demsculpinboyz TaxID=2041528 RepID=A0A2D1G9R4_9CAUD|nr:minor tail protein [Mycobacterium phage Demsculpinboyz]ATN88618.1 minor tail protein [Mycobacterium phage Demsculpinboyz]